MILEQLSVLQLVTMLDTQRNINDVIVEVLRKKLVHKEVIFSSRFEVRSKNPNPSSNEFHYVIRFKHLPTIARVLRHFGHVISNLGITNHETLSYKIAKKLYQMINFYCADTLTQLSMENQSNDFFALLEKPFKKVERLTLAGEFFDLNSSKFSFRELFPSLRKLDLRTNLELTEHMPHLEALNGDCGKSKIVESLKEVILKNPQIRKLNLNSVTSEWLNIVSNHLPNLEELEIWTSCVDTSDQITYNFPNVKKFSQTGYFASCFKFGDLEELYIFATEEESYKLIQFALDYKRTLKKLTIIPTLMDSDILRLANANLSLIELNLVCFNGVSVESIVELIENNKHLIKLTISFGGPELQRKVFEFIREQFKNEWKIENSSYFGVVINRKISESE